MIPYPTHESGPFWFYHWQLRYSVANWKTSVYLRKSQHVSSTQILQMQLQLERSDVGLSGGLYYMAECCMRTLFIFSQSHLHLHFQSGCRQLAAKWTQNTRRTGQASKLLHMLECRQRNIMGFNYKQWNRCIFRQINYIYSFFYMRDLYVKHKHCPTSTGVPRTPS